MHFQINYPELKDLYSFTILKFANEQTKYKNYFL